MYCGRPVRSTSITLSLSLSKEGSMMLNALEKIKEMNPHIGSWHIQMSVGLVEHIEDSVLHPHMSLVRKLQWIKCVFNIWSQEVEKQPLQGLHDVQCEGYWSVVIHLSWTPYFGNWHKIQRLP